MHRETVALVLDPYSVSGQMYMPLPETSHSRVHMPSYNPAVSQIGPSSWQSPTLVHGPPIQPGLRSLPWGMVPP